MGQPTNGQLPLIALLKKPAAVEAGVIESFGEDEDAAVKAAIAWAWRSRRVKGMTQRNAAEQCGIKAQHFSNVLLGRKYLPPQKINQFEWTVGNTALSQTIKRFGDVREQQMRQQLGELLAEHLNKVA